jgi:hypothetical protein
VSGGCARFRHAHEIVDNRASGTILQRDQHHIRCANVIGVAEIPLFTAGATGRPLKISTP